MEYTPEQLSRINELRNMTEPQWDSICRGCGVCCLFKVVFGKSRVYYTNICCENLDTKTKKCNIVEHRCERTGRKCAKVDLDVVLSDRLLARTCGYVEYIFGPAPRAININWSHVIPANQLDSEDFATVLRHRIPGSTRWNGR